MGRSLNNRFSAFGTTALVLAVTGLMFLASPRLRGLLANSAWLACGTAVIALPIGAFLGSIIAKVDLPGRRVLAWLLIGMMFVPLYVQAAAWNAMLGSGGWVVQMLGGDGYSPTGFSGWPAAIWIHAMSAVPWVALLTAASLRAVERRLEEEALLDASPLRVIARVSLRRGAAGVWAAALWTAVVCITEIAVTDLFQLRTFAEEIYTEATLGSLSGSPTQLLHSDLAIGVTLIALLVGLAIRTMAPWLPAAASVSAGASWKWRPSRGRWTGAIVVWLLATAVLLLPVAGLVWKAGIAVRRIDGGYVRGWSAAKALTMVASSPWEQRREWGWSLAIAGVAAAFALMLGILLAWLARVRKQTIKPLALLIALGVAVPAPLWGVWVIGLLNHSRESMFAPLTVLYDRTLAAPILVQMIRALPLVSLWLWSQFSSVSRDLLDAARSDGAGPVAQLLRVALPARLPAIGAAALIGFLLALGEVSATLLVVPPGVTTISVRVFQLIHYGIDDRVAALALSIFGLLAIIIVTVALVRRVPGRRDC